MTIPSGVIAHRGASLYAPENTLAAFALAHDLGAAWIELDVMLTQDQVAIVHHDDDFKRTAGLPLLVAETPYARVQGMDAGSWFSPEYAGERIPTLAQTLDLAKRLGLKLNLEIKPTVGKERETATAIMTLLKDRDIKPEDVLLSSFSLSALEIAQGLAPHFLYGWLADKPEDLQVGLSAGLPFATLNLNKNFLTQHLSTDLRQRGYAVLVYTVNDPLEAKRLLKMGVNAVFSDNPRLLG